MMRSFSHLVATRINDMLRYHNGNVMLRRVNEEGRHTRAILTIYSLEQHRARVHPETSEYMM